jgi:Flp pilus assembly protein TadG
MIMSLGDACYSVAATRRAQGRATFRKNKKKVWAQDTGDAIANIIYGEHKIQPRRKASYFVGNFCVQTRWRPGTWRARKKNEQKLIVCWRSDTFSAHYKFYKLRAIENDDIFDIHFLVSFFVVFLCTNVFR